MPLDENELDDRFCHSPAHTIALLHGSCRLCYDAIGNLIIIAEENDKQRVFLHQHITCGHAPYQLNEWDAHKHTLQPHVQDDLSRPYFDEGKKRIPAIAYAYPQLSMFYINELKELSEMEDHLRVAQWLMEHPPVAKKQYPLPYLVLLCYHPKPELIDTALRESGGKITTGVLCQAIGIQHLTHGMKRCLRMVTPIYSPDRYRAVIYTAMEQWHLFSDKMNTAKPVFDLDMEMFLDMATEYPWLHSCKWFTPESASDGCGFRELRQLKNYLSMTQPQHHFIEILRDKICNRRKFNALLEEAEDYFASEQYTDEFADDRALAAHPIIPKYPLLQCITTVGELRKYAAELENCASGYSYLKAAMNGDCYLYYYENEWYSPESKPMKEIGMLELHGERLRQRLSQSPSITYRDLNDHRIILQFSGKNNQPMSQNAWVWLKFIFDELEMEIDSRFCKAANVGDSQ